MADVLTIEQLGRAEAALMDASKRAWGGHEANHPAFVLGNLVASYEELRARLEIAEADLRESDDYTVALERVALAAYASTDAEESWQGYVEDRGKMDDALEALDDQHHARWLAALGAAREEQRNG